MSDWVWCVYWSTGALTVEEYAERLSWFARQAVAGMSADGRAVARMAQNICVRFRQNFGEAITPATLAEQLADVFYAYTSYAAYRPFGVHALVVGYDDEAREHELYLCELDGTFHRYFGTAIGKGARSAKTEIQKLKVSTMTCREALPTVARMCVPMSLRRSGRVVLGLRCGCSRAHERGVVWYGVVWQSALGPRLDQGQAVRA